MSQEGTLKRPREDTKVEDQKEVDPEIEKARKELHAVIQSSVTHYVRVIGGEINYIESAEKRDMIMRIGVELFEDYAKKIRKAFESRPLDDGGANVKFRFFPRLENHNYKEW